jgi:hypothetical protein
MGNRDKTNDYFNTGRHPSGRSQLADVTAAGLHRKAMTWCLLAVWLAYSAAALGWQLVHDPLLSTYICMRR